MSKRPLSTRLLAFGSLLIAGCSTQSNYLGFDRLTAVEPPATSDPPSTSSEPPPKIDSGTHTSESTATESTAPTSSPAPDSGPDAMPGTDAGPIEAGAMDASLDSGHVAEETDAGSRPMPNHFVDVLGVPPEEVNRRIQAVYEQLFHGGENEKIYYEVGDDEAYIFDVAHEDTRMDALGYGMFVSVQLNHQEEFDRIWKFAKNRMRYPDGAHMGHFALQCDLTEAVCSEEIATLGTFFTLTSLMFAEARWGSNGDAGAAYQEDASALLYVLRDIEGRNRDGDTNITNAFHPVTNLPQKGPTTELQEWVYPSNVWPAFFQIWGDKTGEAYWDTVADSSRRYLQIAAHPTTGLVANTTTSDGASVEGFDVFDSDSYGLWLSLALDQTWYGTDAWQVEEANRVLTFFSTTFGASGYPATFTPNGDPEDLFSNSGALVAMNGALAGIATVPEREAFIRRVWDTPAPRDFFRYFDGITQLLSMMYLGGVLRPY